jgi:hypothetical protein
MIEFNIFGVKMLTQHNTTQHNTTQQSNLKTSLQKYSSFFEYSPKKLIFTVAILFLLINLPMQIIPMQRMLSLTLLP